MPFNMHNSKNTNRIKAKLFYLSMSHLQYTVLHHFPDFQN